jgi:hypothetical protein
MAGCVVCGDVWVALWYIPIVIWLSYLHNLRYKLFKERLISSSNVYFLFVCIWLWSVMIWSADIRAESWIILSQYRLINSISLILIMPLKGINIWFNFWNASLHHISAHRCFLKGSLICFVSYMKSLFACMCYQIHLANFVLAYVSGRTEIAYW